MSVTSVVIEKCLIIIDFSVTWDTPLHTFMGDSVRMYDDLLTKQVNIRDILSHKMGVPPYFVALLVGYPTEVTRQEVVK